MKKLFLLLVMVLIGMTACQKDPISRDILYEVSFAPTLNGEVVPWVNNDMLKSFETFEHKYANHVIRIYNSELARVIDIPITNTPTGTYTYSLPAGNYSCEVLPITENTTNGPGQYTYDDALLNHFTMKKAFIFTPARVPFTVIGVMPTVHINCTNPMACLQFNLNEMTISEAGTPNVWIWGINDAAFLTAHNVAGQEQATPAQLQAASNPIIQQAGGAGDFDSFWFDDDANIYYLYMVPGSPNAITLPDGTGNTSNIQYNGAFAHYMAFDFDNGGLEFPVFWLKDYYNSRTWIPNTTMRVSYTGGAFIVTQQSWFETIVTP